MARDLVLQIENVLQLAIVMFRPHVVAGLGIDELCCNSHPVAGPAHAALDDVAHTEFISDFSNIWRLSLICESRISGDDGKRPPKR